MNEKQRSGYEITIRWFLGYCKRVQQPATTEQAHLFMDEAVANKGPNEWVEQQWKNGINWFSRQRSVWKRWMEMRAFLDHLAVHDRVSAGTQRQALNALVFYFLWLLN